MFRPIPKSLVSGILLCAAYATASWADVKPKRTPSAPHATTTDKRGRQGTNGTAAGNGSTGVPLLPGSGSKEPVSINADTLDFLNKENKLIYTGHLVAVQGLSTLKASRLDIDIERNAPGDGQSVPSKDATPAAGNSSVRHMEADGPVTLMSKDQVGTGDHATYDKRENKVYLKGNVTLSQGPNVVQGDELIYDVPSGQAKVIGNVTSVFKPGEGPRGGGAAHGQDEPSNTR